jgi:hypothetical protein
MHGLKNATYANNFTPPTEIMHNITNAYDTQLHNMTNACKILSEKRRDYLGDPVVDGRIMLKLILYRV